MRVYVAPGTYGVSPVGAFTIAIGACSAGDGARTPALQTAAAVPSCWVRTVWWHWIGSARTWLRRSLSATPGLPSTTAGSLARRFTDDSWAGIETATADLTDRAAGLLPVDRRVKLGARATVDLDSTDVEVYGSRKQGWPTTTRGSGQVARAGRPGPRRELRSRLSCWQATPTSSPSPRRGDANL